METGISRPSWTTGELFAFADNTIALIRRAFLIAYQIKQVNLRGINLTIDGAKVSGNFAMPAIAKQLKWVMVSRFPHIHGNHAVQW